MNGYVAFYKGKRIEILAESSYKAQLEAAKQFKAKHAWQVNIALAEKAGEQIIHDGAIL